MMNEAEREQIEIMIREQVLAMLKSMAEAADWYTDGYSDMTESAAYVVKDVAARMASDLDAEPDPLDGLMTTVLAIDPAEFSPVQLSGRLSVSDPEPVNPFAPKLTAEQYATMLRVTIAAAEKDGHDVWIKNDCCGCSRMTLEVGSETDHVRVIGEAK